MLIWLVAGCELMIPDVKRREEPSPLAVRDGRLRAIQPIRASAGHLRVVEGALDIAAPACRGSGEQRRCVRGGLTAGGKGGR